MSSDCFAEALWRFKEGMGPGRDRSVQRSYAAIAAAERRRRADVEVFLSAMYRGEAYVVCGDHVEDYVIS